MNNDLYILTRAHFSGDHCDIYGIFTTFSNAQEAHKELLTKIKSCDDNMLIDITKVSNDKINKLLLVNDCGCDCTMNSEEESCESENEN
jgi:hypothetical protein